MCIDSVKKCAYIYMSALEYTPNAPKNREKIRESHAALQIIVESCEKNMCTKTQSSLEHPKKARKCTAFAMYRFPTHFFHLHSPRLSKTFKFISFLKCGSPFIKCTNMWAHNPSGGVPLHARKHYKPLQIHSSVTASCVSAC